MVQAGLLRGAVCSGGAVATASTGSGVAMAGSTSVVWSIDSGPLDLPLSRAKRGRGEARSPTNFKGQIPQVKSTTV